MGAIKNKAIEIAIKQGLEKVKEDPDKNLPKLVEIVKKFDKDNMWESKYQFLEKVTKDRDNNWNQYIRNIMEDIDDDIIEKFLCNFIVNSAIKGISRNHEVKEKEGCGANTDLLTTPEQREAMYYKLAEYRKTKPLFTVDFWNDGRFVGGCIAGGKHYMHINANGDVEPCVFIHYSNANVKDMSLLETLKQPIFKEYQKNQLQRM